MKSKFSLFICSLLIFSGFVSCKKTVDIPARSNSKILAYKVPVSDGDINGVIDESDHTITVYLPFYYQLDVIDPKVKLADGAVLKEKIEPVEVLNDQTTYTVTGADKSTTTYKLIIKLQQISPLTIAEVSTETTPVEWSIGFSSIVIKGNFNTNDATKIKTFLVGADGKEHALENSVSFYTVVAPIVENGVKNYILSYKQVPQNLDPGTYKLRVKVQSLTAEAKYPVNLVYGRPAIKYEGVVAKQGETFNIVSVTNVFYKFTEFSIMVNGKKVVLPIESYTRSKAIIRIPDDVPPGVYNPTAKFEGWPDTYNSWTLTVNPK